MRILQVITSLRIGGAEKLIVDMVPLYQEQGHQVDVLLFDGIDTPFKKQLQDKGVQVYTLGEGGSVYNPLFIFKLIPYLKKYDIVHTHNTACQLFVAIASLFASCKLITTEHSSNNRRRGKKVFEWIDHWMYNRYHSIVCISDKTKDNLCSYLGTDKNISTIYNGINTQQFQETTENPNFQTGRTVVTMVAGFRYEKDHETLIRAFTHLPKDGFELWLVGDGEQHSLIEALIQELNLQNVVRLWGIRSDVPTILKSSDIIVMSSHFEGLSLSSIEGMSVGKPFIASDVDGLHEITEGAGLLFPHGDDKALAALIEKLANDKELYQEVANKCLKRASEYDIRKTVETYLNLYKTH